MCLSSNLKGIQHVGIPVSNIEISKKWYIETLGFQLMYETRLSSDSDDAKVAFIKVGDLVIEMYELAGGELEEIKSRGHGHIDHIAFDVNDIDSIYKKLKELGIEAIEGTPKFLPFWENGVRFLTIFGPDKEKIEFNQKL